MKHILLGLKNILLLILLCTILTVSINNLSSGLSTGVFFDGACSLRFSYFYGFPLLIIISLQLVAMRCSTFAFNILLTVFSVLLFAEMATLAFGPAIAQTPAIHQHAVDSGLGNILCTNSALYWLIPLCWFISLMGAKHQVRIFCMTLVCYILWIILTPMLNGLVSNWGDQENPVLSQTINILSGADWMPAVAIGCFLLIFAFMVDLLENIFPEKKTQEAERKTKQN